MIVTRVLAFLKRHFLLGLGIMCFALTVILGATISLPKVYQSQTTFYIQQQIPNGYTGPATDDMRDHIRILKSDRVIGILTQKMAQEFPKHRPLKDSEIIKRLRADSGVSNSEAGQSTKVVDLKFQDTDRHYAAAVLREALTAYAEALHWIAGETKVKGLAFLRARLTKVQQERRTLEQRLEMLASESGTTDLDLKNSELIRVGSNYSQTLGGVNAEIASSESELSDLQQTLGFSPSQAMPLFALKDDIQLQTWQKQLASQEADLSQLKALYTSSYPLVKQKERAVQETRLLIKTRAESILGPVAKRSVRGNTAMSDIDKEMGKKLLELNLNRLALLSKKSQYESQLDDLAKSVPTLASQKREQMFLTFALDSLKTEERKLSDRLQDGTLEQANLLNAASFIVLSPPVLPDAKDYIYPLHPMSSLVYGFPTALGLALLGMALAEWLHPPVNAPEYHAAILGEIPSGESWDLHRQLLPVYQHMVYAIEKMGIRTIALVDLYDSLTADVSIQKANPYMSRPGSFEVSPVAVAEELANMFSQRNIWTLLVDPYSQIQSQVSNTLSEMQVGEWQGYGLYRSQVYDHRFTLRLKNIENEVFDPLVFNTMPGLNRFGLVLIRTDMASHGAIRDVDMKVLSLVSQATILNVSRRYTRHNQLKPFRTAAAENRLAVLGSILVP